MKFNVIDNKEARAEVASLAEAWIEIMELTHKQKVVLVASLAEAWIEIIKIITNILTSVSPPSRRRGLKSKYLYHLVYCVRRLPRGGVD